MPAKAAVKREKAVNPQRGQQKGHRQPQRINPQQQYALADGVFRSGEGKNDREDGANAGRPAEGKSKTHQKGADCAAAALQPVQAFVGIQQFDGDQAGQVQSKDDDDHAGNPPQQPQVRAQPLAKSPGQTSHGQNHNG